MLASPNLSDNVVAVLTRLGEQPGTVPRILERIVAADRGVRAGALTELAILAGLRKLTGEVRQEAMKMPVTEDILENEFFGPPFRQGRAEGQVEILLYQIENRFGTARPGLRARLSSLNPDQLRAASLRLLTATRLDDLFD